jgi:preprotein translocase subunit Sec61beta
VRTVGASLFLPVARMLWRFHAVGIISKFEIEELRKIKIRP